MDKLRNDEVHELQAQIQQLQGQIAVDVSKTDFVTALCVVWQQNESVAAKNFGRLKNGADPNLLISASLRAELEQMIPCARGSRTQR